MEPFQYDPLPEPDSIRLLFLEPSSDHASDIHCSLNHTTLIDCKNDIIDQYTALSYVWGDPDPSQTISVNGNAFHVTANLFHALRDLRDEQRLRRLWIDAICIDQSNLDERNRQVNMMGKIYETAQHTVIYLGEETFDSAWVFGALSTLNTPQDVLEFSLLGRLRHAVHSILSKPWFMRVWIFQELVLSLDPWIQLGRARMEWDQVCRHIGVLRAGGPLEQDEGNVFLASRYDMLNEMDSTRRRHHEAKFSHKAIRPELLDVLHSRRAFGATDQRDRLFAHLSIANPPRDFQIDYSKAFVEVYSSLIMRTIISTRNLNALSYVESVPTAFRSPGLPSWVPDWSLPITQDPKLRSNPHLRKVYVPNGPTHQSKFLHEEAQLPSPMERIWLQVPSILVLDGLQTDIVRIVSPPISDRHPYTTTDTLNQSAPKKVNSRTSAWSTYCTCYNAWRKVPGFEFLEPLHHNVKDQVSAEWFSEYHDNGSNNLTIKKSLPKVLASLLVLHGQKETENPLKLSGRSIACFQKSRHNISIVPSTTRPGDILCSLDYQNNFILRPIAFAGQKVQMVVDVALQQNYNPTSTGRSRQIPEVAHVSLVGVCITVRSIPGTSGPANADPRVFVIH